MKKVSRILYQLKMFRDAKQTENCAVAIVWHK